MNGTMTYPLDFSPDEVEKPISELLVAEVEVNREIGADGPCVDTGAPE